MIPMYLVNTLHEYSIQVLKTNQFVSYRILNNVTIFYKKQTAIRWNVASGVEILYCTV